MTDKKQGPVSDACKNIQKLFSQETKTFTHAQLAEKLGVSKVVSQRMAEKCVEEGAVICVRGTAGLIYFSAEAGIYKNHEEFVSLLPADVRYELGKILKRTMGNGGKKDSRSSSTLVARAKKALKLDGRVTKRYLAYLVSKGLVRESGDGIFSINNIAKNFDFTDEDIKKLDAIAQENRNRASEVLEELREGDTGTQRISLAEADKWRRQDASGKTDAEIVREPAKDGGLEPILFLNLMLAGHQATSYNFLERKVAEIEALPADRRPKLIIAHGAFLGTFQHEEVRRKRTHVRRLSKMAAQLALFREVMKGLEIPFIYVTGSSEDERIVRHYASKIYYQEEEVASLGVAKEVLQIIAKQQKMFQSEIYQRIEQEQQRFVFPHAIRKMRPLKNADKMAIDHNVSVDEWKLVIEACEAIQKGQAIASETARVLDVPRLTNQPDRSVVGKLRLREGQMTLEMRSRITHSETAVYQSPLQHLRDALRKEFSGPAKKEDIPDLFVVGNDGVFGYMYVPPPLFGDAKPTGCHVITLPGLQDMELVKNMDPFYTQVKQDRVFKALTRKRIVRPAILQKLWGTSDHLHMQIDNLRFLQARQSWKGKNEKGERVEERAIIAHAADMQLGLDTARVDLWMKFLDYAMYTVGADTLINNGDLINGLNYLAAFSENIGTNLPSVDMQLTALRYLVKILFKSENMPKLKRVRTTEGNHEWNTPPKSQHFDIQHLRRIADAIEDTRPDVDNRYCKRIFLRNRGIEIPASLGTDSICGLRVAYSHLWSLKRMQGAIPTGEQKDFARAHGAKTFDIMLGGHQASMYAELDGDRLHLVVPGFMDPTKFTVFMHQAQNVLSCLLHLSTAENEPPVLEMVTGSFLEKYIPQSPAFKNRTAKDLLKEACDFARKPDSTE